MIMTTLLHLVSEQTMQNLLPILALKPKTVIQVRSRPDNFHQAAENLKNAVAAMSKSEQYKDLEPEYVEVVIDEDSPSVESTRSKIGEVLQRHGATINLTGGTKQMSIGAYLAAEGHQAPALYCDTAKRQFISVGHRPLPELLAFDEVVACLTVEAVMAAHGTKPGNLRSDRPTDALLAAGRAGFEAWRNDSPCFGEFGEKIRSHFRTKKKGRIPSGSARLRKLVSKPLPPPPTSPALTRFLDTLVEAHLLKRDSDNYFPNVPPERAKVEQLANLMNGSWLELYVYDLLQSRPHRWSDPRWSVEPRQPSEAAFGETDVVCVNVQAAALQIISCKTSLRQPLETLEALAQRRRDMGGTFAKATLALLEVPKQEQETLTNWASWLNVQVLIGDEITSAFSS